MFRKLILLTTCLLISSCWGYAATGIVPMSVSAACPFCSAVNATFSENIKSNQIVVFAKLTKQPPEIEEDDVALPKAEFEVVTIHKGQEFVTEGMRFKALLVGKYDLGQDFLVMGLDPPAIIWSTPLKANEKLISYIQALKTLPEEGADRLAFFQKYLEHEDPILTYDAYDEFARAKYSDLIALKDRMDRATLIKWISDMEIPVNRRRLYFTMLGVCGNADDALKLEELIRSGDRERQSGLDALTAAYLTLTGDKGMDVIDEHLLSDPKADDLQLLSVKAALTFHAMDKDANVISKDRILKSLRKFLDRPAIADAVLPDLSRMKDWSVLDRVVKLYGELESNFQKVIIIQYLQACPLAEAKAHLEEIKKKDPDTVRRAAFMSDFDFNETDEDKKEEPEKTKPDGDLVSYTQTLKTLPKEGVDRLAFFQKYLEHEDPNLSKAAYDEFANAKYSDLSALKDRMDRVTLMKWICDMEIPVNRRRLYFTMLGVCGNADDALKLEELIRSGDRERQSGLDALTAAYLTLTGDKGMDVIDEHLLSDPKADDLQLLSVKAALTFHAMEKDAKAISNDRILKSLRKFLDRPAIADFVLPDLARMNDWSVLDRVVKLYGELESVFQKVVIIQYLQACPLAEAKAQLEEINKKDPEIVRRVTFMNEFDNGKKDEPEKPKSDDGKGGAADSEDLSDRNADVDKVVAYKVPVEDLAESNASVPRLNESVESRAEQSEEGTFTSAPSEPITPAGVSKDVAEVAQVDRENRSALESVPTEEPKKGSFRLGVVVLTLPMIVSFGVFLLIWSVISGWFERLIF